VLVLVLVLDSCLPRSGAPADRGQGRGRERGRQG